MKGELQDEDIRIIIVYIFIFIVIILLPTGLARRYVDSRDLALPL